MGRKGRRLVSFELSANYGPIGSETKAQRPSNAIEFRKRSRIFFAHCILLGLGQIGLGSAQSAYGTDRLGLDPIGTCYRHLAETLHLGFESTANIACEHLVCLRIPHNPLGGGIPLKLAV